MRRAFERVVAGLLLVGLVLTGCSESTEGLSPTSVTGKIVETVDTVKNGTELRYFRVEGEDVPYLVTLAKYPFDIQVGNVVRFEWWKAWEGRAVVDNSLEVLYRAPSPSPSPVPTS